MAAGTFLLKAIYLSTTKLDYCLPPYVLLLYINSCLVTSLVVTQIKMTHSLRLIVIFWGGVKEFGQDEGFDIIYSCFVISVVVFPFLHLLISHSFFHHVFSI